LFTGTYVLLGLVGSIALQHCKEDPIYVFPEMKLLRLVRNFHIRVSVRNLYIPTIGAPILLQQNRQFLSLSHLRV
jgi:hypothetical protein